MKKKISLTYLFAFISLLWYIILYYQIDRSQFLILISGVLTLGAIYFYWIVIKPFTKKEIISLAILFRVVFLVGTPNFSDDFNRFIWDGKVIVNGGNPYNYTPTQLLDKQVEFRVGNFENLYENLNSKDYYTVYPPVNQFLFAAAELFGNGNTFYSVVFMKLFILLFEIGLIFLIFKMLKKLKLKESLAQIYALNPLVIIELTGNVHFEGVMLFFLLLGFWLVLTNSLFVAGIAVGLAINTKIVPLLFLPLFLPLLGLIKSLKLYAVIAVLSIILITPFINPTLILNFSDSLGLYFQSFEFNASFYYVIKGISYIFLGYKSTLVGVLIPATIFLLAVFSTIKLYRITKFEPPAKFDFLLFIRYALPLLFVFYSFASTVHPWYIINLVILSVFIPSRAVLSWSILSFVSYFAYSAYIENNYQGVFHDSIWYYIIIGIEYSIVFIFYIFDRRNKLKYEN